MFSGRVSDTIEPLPNTPDVSRSYELYRQAETLIPGRTQLISRRADQFANGISSVYAQRAKGSRFVDLDIASVTF